MKKFVFISIFITVCSIAFSETSADTYYIYDYKSFNKIVYTVRDNFIYEGTSVTKKLYEIDGNFIRDYNHWTNIIYEIDYFLDRIIIRDYNKSWPRNIIYQIERDLVRDYNKYTNVIYRIEKR
jgi:hypothetical protein